MTQLTKEEYNLVAQGLTKVPTQDLNTASVFIGLVQKIQTIIKELDQPPKTTKQEKE